jgi:hypothetical protein
LISKLDRNALGFMIEKTATITTSAKKIHTGLVDENTRAPASARPDRRGSGPPAPPAPPGPAGPSGRPSAGVRDAVSPTELT